MDISKEEINHLANLSRLNFTSQETEKFAKDLTSIANMAGEIGLLNTDNVDVMSHAIIVENVFRKDEVKESFDREEILKNAPTKDFGCITVPKVVEHD